MDVPLRDRDEAGGVVRAVAAWRRVGWIIVLVAEVGLLAWAAMAAIAPQRLPGPDGVPILTAGYEGYTGASWEQLTATAPETADYTTLLFRMYGIYGVGLSLLAIAIVVTGFRRGERWAWWALLVGNTIGYGAAMIYDQIVNAVGPFELSEYLGLALVYLTLGVTYSAFAFGTTPEGSVRHAPAH